MIASGTGAVAVPASRAAPSADLPGAASNPGAMTHCAALAHHALKLTPPASCRLSFYFCNTLGDVDRAVAAVVAGQIEPAGPWYWRRPRPTRSRLARAPVPS
jgi:hypothetical protein